MVKPQTVPGAYIAEKKDKLFAELSKLAAKEQDSEELRLIGDIV